MPKEDGMPDQHLLPNAELEYTTCIDFCKYSGGIQLAQISMFLALMSGAAYFLFGEKPPSEPILTFLKLGAGISALAFWVVEETHAYLASNFFCRARELEKKLGFAAFLRLPKRSPFWCGPTNWAFRLLYWGSVVFWVHSVWSK
jgi:hypothetical protein